MDAQTTIPANETDDQRDIRLNKDTAAFSYVWIMSVIIFAAHRDSKFIRFHSKQAMVLFALTIPAAMIPFIGKFLIILLVAGMLLGFINAAQGHYSDVPIIGDLLKGKLDIAGISKTAARGLHQGLESVNSVLKKHADTPAATAPEPQAAPPADKPTSPPAA